jgi:very-short-patch-repair endonuclease
MENKSHHIIVGQRISATKLQRAKELRQHMTEPEKLLWQRLRANRLNGLHFRRQQIIDGFIVDFYCHAARLVVEVDGDIHQQQVEYDAERDKVLALRGLRLLRVTNEEVQHDLEDVLAQIAALCDS